MVRSSIDEKADRIFTDVFMCPSDFWKDLKKVTQKVNNQREEYDSRNRQNRQGGRRNG